MDLLEMRMGEKWRNMIEIHDNLKKKRTLKNVPACYLAKLGTISILHKVDIVSTGAFL